MKRVIYSSTSVRSERIASASILDGDIFEGKKYKVEGYTSYEPGELSDYSGATLTDDPKVAIATWFKLNKRFPMRVDISTQTKASACELIDYAANHMDWVLSLCDRYNYRAAESLAAAIREVHRRGPLFHDRQYGDMIYPFDIG